MTAQRTSLKPRENWLDHRGPDGRRGVHRPIPKQKPQLAWSIQLPGGHGIGAPVIADGQLIIGCMSNGSFDECVLQSHDASTGKLQWRHQVDGSIEGGALIHQGLVYVGTTCGSVSMPCGDQWRRSVALE